MFALSACPLLLLAWRGLRQGLGPNPIEFVTRATGDWTLRFLLLTLSITPLRKLLNQPALIRFRRMLGLFAFFYGVLHLITYAWLDQFFDFADMWKDVGQRPFITAGLAGFVLMIPLAVTSTAGWIRRLGGRRWRLLHRLIYAAAAAGVAHYYWLVKSDVRLPLLYAGVLSVLLLYRIGSSGRFQRHWPEYGMEAAGLGFFMICACFFTILLEYPASPVHQAIPSAFARRALIGLAMGLTAITIVYSPWGKQSGAHLNPSLTLAFLRLGKIDPRDAFFYILAQFTGGAAGVILVAAFFRRFVAHPGVHYAVTVPGPDGPAVAFIAELAISFLLMSIVLLVSNAPRLARYTGLFAGALVAAFISFEAPLSGMSMNPARTLGSALPAGSWTALWIYFTAPPAGMLLAAQVYLAARGARAVSCAKLHHQNSKRCIFCQHQAGLP